MTNRTPVWQWEPPVVGQRMLKTALAVLVCLIIYALRGYRIGDMPSESMITAIICMQPYIRDTKSYAVSRLFGTAIGASLGLGFFFLLEHVPALTARTPMLYLVMAAGVLLALYSAVALNKADAAGLSSIVFLCIVINFPEIESPLRDAYLRILDTFIGTAVAVCINVFRLPRRRVRDQVFFLRASDLVPHRLAEVSPAVRFRLNSLYGDGARICLMAEHAPAFFTQQMAAVKPNTPMIVMDGAAIYDVADNSYLYTEKIPEPDARLLIGLLKNRGTGFSVYVVHSSTTHIFHEGPMNERELDVYYRMRKSPYRSYLAGSDYRLNEIVYFKLVDDDRRIRALADELRKKLPEGHIRLAVRPQAGFEGTSGLYCYSARATQANAIAELLRLLRSETGEPHAQILFDLDGYRSQRGVLRLLQRLANAYEPLALPFSGRRTG